MIRQVVLSSLMLFLLVGCGKKSSPEDAVGEFYDLSQVARQDSLSRAEASMIRLFSKQDRERFDTCAHNLNKRYDTTAFKPADCLSLEVFEGTRGKPEMTRVASGTSRVRLEIVSNETTRLVELVNEDGWRIDLNATVALNGPEKQP